MTLAQRVDGYLKSVSAPSEKSGQVITSRDLQDVLRGATVDAGVDVNPTTAMHFTTVYACVKVLAEDIGKIPLKLYKRNGENNDRQRSHYLQKLLRKPNDYMTGQEFWEMCIFALKLRGNFYAHIVRSPVSGKIIELLPYPDGACVAKKRTGGEVVYSVTLGGAEDILKISEVLHIKGPSVDGLNGLSDISQARNAIGLGMATEKHGAILFKNGAQVNGVLSTEQVIDDDAYERIKESWQATHQGVDNAHKTAILEAGLAYSPMGMTNNDAQFLDTRKYQRTEICGMFRVPPHKIGDLERATFSNIEHQSLEYATDALQPICTRIENRINDFMLDEARDHAALYVKFDMNSLIRGDMKSRGEFYTKQIQNGVYSPNEVRALEDMNPREGGDVYLTPVNMLINGKAPPDADEKTSTDT